MNHIIRQLIIAGGVGVSAGLLIIVALFVLPTPSFTATTVSIPSGATVSKAADNLAQSGVVWHQILVSVPLLLQNKTITAGRYKFNDAQNPLTVSRRLADGDFQMTQQKVVIPEGFTREDIADRLVSELGSEFSQQEFLQTTDGQEGYLFPDTYRISDTMSEQQIATAMRTNFRRQIKKLQPELQEFPRSQSEIIRMASLVETEAGDYKIRRRVAGVLWQRLEQDMPLQADAVFAYLLDKSSQELTQEDLAMDSPYNLYTNTGLPPTPIANPGLDAIRATINPIRTDDRYYLTGDNGEFYFAETLEEHQQNKRKFIGG